MFVQRPTWCADDDQTIDGMDTLVTTPPNNAPMAIRTDPFETIQIWLNDATETEINDPNAMTLATVDKSGRPNARMVLLKGIDPQGADPRGLLLYTNLESTKGHELTHNNHAALLFHWKSVRRQIRIRGTTSRVSTHEADAYFATRPRGSQIGAWASDQSRPLNAHATLEKRVKDVTNKYDGTDVPRPQHWSGFRLLPLEIEFWQDGAFRLHHRLLYRRDTHSSAWTTTLLYP